MSKLNILFLSVIVAIAIFSNVDAKNMKAKVKQTGYTPEDLFGSLNKDQIKVMLNSLKLLKEKSDDPNFFPTVFSTFDFDKNEFIDQNEAAQLMNFIVNFVNIPPFSDDVKKAFWDEADANKDGKITKKEFIKEVNTVVKRYSKYFNDRLKQL